MLEERIKEYYDKLVPSDEVKCALLEKVRVLRRKQAVFRLIYECTGSMAACFLLALLINTAEIVSNTVTPDKMLASVISEPSGYTFAAMLLFILIALFVILFIRKIYKKDGNHRRH